MKVCKALRVMPGVWWAGAMLGAGILTVAHVTIILSSHTLVQLTFLKLISLLGDSSVDASNRTHPTAV